MRLLDKAYEGATKGIAKVSPPIEKMASDYLRKNKDTRTAAQSFIRYQIAKCTTSGVVTGFGGIVTLPVAVPANVGSVLYVQMRMIAGLAYMGGYDTDSDQVQTLVYACLAGVAIGDILKMAGLKVGEKVAFEMIKKVPGAALIKINKMVGFRLITKFGSKGIVNIGKLVPVVGSAISGGVDFTETKIIADRAYKMFIKGDFSVLTKGEKDDTVIIMEEDD